MPLARPRRDTRTPPTAKAASPGPTQARRGGARIPTDRAGRALGLVHHDGTGGRLSSERAAGESGDEQTTPVDLAARPTREVGDGRSYRHRSFAHGAPLAAWAIAELAYRLCSVADQLVAGSHGGRGTECHRRRGPYHDYERRSAAGGSATRDAALYTVLRAAARSFFGSAANQPRRVIVGLFSTRRRLLSRELGAKLARGTQADEGGRRIAQGLTKGPGGPRATSKRGGVARAHRAADAPGEDAER